MDDPDRIRVTTEDAEWRVEVLRRIHNAEEQAAAAWDRVGKLEKVVEELREGVATDLQELRERLP